MMHTKLGQTQMTFDEQVERLLDTHPRPLTPHERDKLRPNMKQILMLLQELGIDLETYESQLVTFQVDKSRYN